MKLGSRKERERESKCDAGKYKQFYEQDNEMERKERLHWQRIKNWNLSPISVLEDLRM